VALLQVSISERLSGLSSGNCENGEPAGVFGRASSEIFPEFGPSPADQNAGVDPGSIHVTDASSAE